MFPGDFIAFVKVVGLEGDGGQKIRQRPIRLHAQSFFHLTGRKAKERFVTSADHFVDVNKMINFLCRFQAGGPYRR